MNEARIMQEDIAFRRNLQCGKVLYPGIVRKEASDATAEVMFIADYFFMRFKNSRTFDSNAPGSNLGACSTPPS